MLREKSTVLVLFGASVLYALFYPSPYAHQIVRDVPVVVVDQDHSSLSRQLVRWLDASEGVRIAERSNDLALAQDRVRAGSAGGVILIPQDFERNVLRREPAYVETYADASYLVIQGTVSRAVNSVVATLSTGVSVRRTQGAGFTADAALKRARPAAFVSWPLFNPVAGYGTFVVPAVFVLILQQTLLIGIGALRVVERHDAIPRDEPLWAILGGKVVATSLIYTVHAVIMFGIVFRLYGFPMRAEWLDLVLFLVPFFCSVTLFGIVIAECFDRPESSTIALGATGVPALFLSGVSFPTEVQPQWLQHLAMALPSTFGIRGFLQLAEMGAGFEQTLRAWAGLCAQTVAYGAMAWVILRYRTRSVSGGGNFVQPHTMG